MLNKLNERVRCSQTVLQETYLPSTLGHGSTSVLLLLLSFQVRTFANVNGCHSRELGHNLKYKQPVSLKPH